MVRAANSVYKFDTKKMVQEIKLHEGYKRNESGQLISYWDGPKDGPKDHVNRRLHTGFGHEVKFKKNKDGTYTNVDPVRDIYGKPITKEGQIISEKDAESLFTDDYVFHLKAASKIPFFADLSPNRQMSMINLTFNMGPYWTTNFPKAMKDYNEAMTSTNATQKANAFYNMGQQLLKFDADDPNSPPSKYAEDTKGRSKFVVERLINDG